MILQIAMIFINIFSILIALSYLTLAEIKFVKTSANNGINQQQQNDRLRNAAAEVIGVGKGG